MILLSCTTKSDWLATVSGRIGGVVADRTLLYVKGGAAWMNSTHSVAVPGGGIIGGPGVGGLTQLTSTESTSWGWLVGMGVEYMFAKNWTGFLEYNYIEFDKKGEAFALAALPELDHQCGSQEQAVHCQGWRELQVLSSTNLSSN